jgi:hypothetical protein
MNSDEGSEKGKVARAVAVGDTVAVRGSGRGGAFMVSVLAVARCANCGAWIVWARTAAGAALLRGHSPGVLCD